MTSPRSYLCDLQDYDRNIIRRTHFNFLFTWTGGRYWIWKCWFLHGSSWTYPLRNQKILGTDSKPRCVYLRRASQSNSRDDCKVWILISFSVVFPKFVNLDFLRLRRFKLQVQEYSWSVDVYQTNWEIKDCNQVWSLTDFRAVVINKWSFKLG